MNAHRITLYVLVPFIVWNGLKNKTMVQPNT